VTRTGRQNRELPREITLGLSATLTSTCWSGSARWMRGTARTVLSGNEARLLSVNSEYHTVFPSLEAESQNEVFSIVPSGRTPLEAKSKYSRVDTASLESLRNRMPCLVSASWPRAWP